MVDPDPKFPAEFEQRIQPFRRQIDTVVKVLGQFKPQQLELIATLHFLANRQKSIFGKSPDKDDVLKAFVDVKGDKFTRQEVGRWYDSLKTANLV